MKRAKRRERDAQHELAAIRDAIGTEGLRLLLGEDADDLTTEGPALQPDEAAATHIRQDVASGALPDTGHNPDPVTAAHRAFHARIERGGGIEDGFTDYLKVKFDAAASGDGRVIVRDGVTNIAPEAPRSRQR